MEQPQENLRIRTQLRKCCANCKHRKQREDQSMFCAREPEAEKAPWDGRLDMTGRRGGEEMIYFVVCDGWSIDLKF